MKPAAKLEPTQTQAKAKPRKQKTTPTKEKNKKDLRQADEEQQIFEETKHQGCLIPVPSRFYTAFDLFIYIIHSQHASPLRNGRSGALSLADC
jgi:hypothetical protein